VGIGAGGGGFFLVIMSPVLNGGNAEVLSERLQTDEKKRVVSTRARSQIEVIAVSAC
jgi:galactokinase/mevalonate kinase-like predicted kinase